jgi:succinate-semialdehyde dehydrogenase/glutarate-semialdehyde dehydrogenase
MIIETINPATGERIARYPEMSRSDVQSVLHRVHTTWGKWNRTEWSERAGPMRAAADVLRRREDRLAKLMALEMGKPLAQGRAEVEKCAWVCDYYAEHAAFFLADEIVDTDATRSYVAFRPLGAVLAVMPWNFPLWQVFRFAAPALMAGNAGVLKHSSNVMGCALAIESVFREAGFPPDLFRTLVIGSKLVRDVIEADEIRAVTLTGSGSAGRAVAAAAGAVLKKTVLELGGSDPYVVLEDADLDETVATCVNSRLINSGQSCIAAKRFIVVDSVLPEFLRRYVELMATKRTGDPFEEGVDVGPQARRDLRDELHAQVTNSISLGAELLLGGTVPSGPGAFYPPTVLAGVRPGMPAYDEELFGPVAAVIGARDEADAVRIANDSAFGLGAAVFTSDLERGERIARDGLDSGACFVNAFVKSDPRLPFGGIKESGYGRELSVFGIREFVNAKTVYVR